MIGRIFLWLFCACRHQWTIHSENPLNLRDEDRNVVSTGKRFILRCDKCGTIKMKDCV